MVSHDLSYSIYGSPLSNLVNWALKLKISLKQIVNKGLLYSTGNSAHNSVITLTGKESEKEWIYVYK